MKVARPSQKMMRELARETRKAVWSDGAYMTGPNGERFFDAIRELRREQESQEQLDRFSRAHDPNLKSLY